MMFVRVNSVNIYESLVNCTPEEFEEKSQKIIDDFVDSLPQERKIKMQQQQWRLEMELRKYKDPVARMNRMIELLWSGFFEFQDAINLED